MIRMIAWYYEGGHFLHIARTFQRFGDVNTLVRVFIYIVQHLLPFVGRQFHLGLLTVANLAYVVLLARATDWVKAALPASQRPLTERLPPQALPVGSVFIVTCPECVIADLVVRVPSLLSKDHAVCVFAAGPGDCYALNRLSNYLVQCMTDSRFPSPYFSPSSLFFPQLFLYICLRSSRINVEHLRGAEVRRKAEGPSVVMRDRNAWATEF